MEIDPNRCYSKDEKVKIAIAQCHTAKEEEAERQGMKPPSVRNITGEMGVPETTMRRHVKTPDVKTIIQQYAAQQDLSPEEEDTLAERAVFMDDWNIAPTKEEFYDLVQIVFKAKGEGSRVPDINWLQRFLQRNEKAKHFFVSRLPRAQN